MQYVIYMLYGKQGQPINKYDLVYTMTDTLAEAQA